jgi:hypothetical protein
MDHRLYEESSSRIRSPRGHKDYIPPKLNGGAALVPYRHILCQFALCCAVKSSYVRRIILVRTHARSFGFCAGSARRINDGTVTGNTTGRANYKVATLVSLLHENYFDNSRNLQLIPSDQEAIISKNRD